jgi:monoamine oxidase
MLDSPQFRPLGGYSSVLCALAGGLDRQHVQLQLHTCVREVRWKPGAVEIGATFLNEPFNRRARCAVITLPLGVLQAAAGAAGAVRFVPPLDAKREALNGLAFGPVLKLSLRFRRAFWEELEGGRYFDASFFHSPDTVFRTFWTTMPLRAPLMTAWMGGPRAAELSKLDTPEIVRHAMESLSTMFGGRPIDEFQLEAAYVHNWQTDPLSQGAYSYLAAGGNNARNQLAEPLSNTLFFAGEATSEDEAATVAGALQSGTRAAREILEPSGRKV